MNFREHIHTVIAYREPDRIPVDLGATPNSGISAFAYHNQEIFSRGGSCVFTTVHNILPDVPPENILAMYETVDDFSFM
jgi:hypothetical protein